MFVFADLCDIQYCVLMYVVSSGEFAALFDCSNVSGYLLASLYVTLVVTVGLFVQATDG